MSGIDVAETVRAGTAALSVAVAKEGSEPSTWRPIGDGGADFGRHLTYVRYYKLGHADLEDAIGRGSRSDRFVLPLLWPLVRLIIRGRETYYADGIEHTRRLGGTWSERPAPDLLWPIYAAGKRRRDVKDRSLGDNFRWYDEDAH
jgi:hypothetical protein